MPVRKFRSVEEMKRDRWRDPGDPALPEVIKGIFGFGEKTSRLSFPPGVYRHRSIEEMNALTDRWALENFKALQDRRDLQCALPPTSIPT